MLQEFESRARTETLWCIGDAREYLRKNVGMRVLSELIARPLKGKKCIVRTNATGNGSVPTFLNRAYFTERAG